VLAASGAVSPAALEAALAGERAARAELESLRFAQQVAEHEVELARANLSRASSTPSSTLPEQLTVRAPVGGRVLKLFHESEAVIAAGAPLMEIGDPNSLEIVIDVLSTEAVRIAAGNLVSVTRWGGPPLEGRVRKVEPSAFTRLSALGVEEQRVNVVVDIRSPRERWATLGDAYRVEVAIAVWEQSDVLKLPSSAVFRHAGGGAAYRIRDERTALVPLELGERNAREVQVLGGAQAGDRVVVYPGDQIRDGVRVRSTP
jgi:HlyD family secretion protein